MIRDVKENRRMHHVPAEFARTEPAQQKAGAAAGTDKECAGKKMEPNVKKDSNASRKKCLSAEDYDEEAVKTKDFYQLL